MTVARVPLRTPSDESLWRQDSVADAELVSAELDRVGAETAGAEHERVGGVVQFVDVGAPVGKHHCPVQVVPGALPPVLEQALLRGARLVGDFESATAGGVGEVVLGVAAAEASQRVSFDRVVLPAVVEEFESAEPVAEGGVEAAGPDRR